MAITIVQTVVGNFGSGTTVTKPYGSAVTAGSLLACLATASGQDTIAVSDNVNGAWTRGPNVASGSTTGDGRSEIWYKANSLSGSITVTNSTGTSTDKHLIIYEVGGIVTTTPLDTSGTANQNVTAGGNASVTTTGSVSQTNVINVMGTLSWNSGSQVFTAGSGYTHDATTNNSTGGDSSGSEHEILTNASGTQTGTQKLTTAETVAVSCLAVFKGSGGGGAPAADSFLMMMGMGQ